MEFWGLTGILPFWRAEGEVWVGQFWGTRSVVWVQGLGIRFGMQRLGIECRGQGLGGNFQVQGTWLRYMGGVWMKGVHGAGFCWSILCGDLFWNAGRSSFGGVRVAGGSVWGEVGFRVSPHTTPGPAAKGGAQDAPQPVPVPPALLPAAAASQGKGLPVPGPGPPVTPATLALGRRSQGPPRNPPSPTSNTPGVFCRAPLPHKASFNPIATSSTGPS